jgi:hypothetical protein
MSSEVETDNRLWAIGAMDEFILVLIYIQQIIS